MRHHNVNRKFGRSKNQREALLKSLALNLIRREQIKTTLAKAKEVRPVVEKLVTKAKKGDLASRRAVLSRLYNKKQETEKLFKVLAPRYSARNGGYTRIFKLGPRNSDGAEMAKIEFVEENK